MGGLSAPPLDNESLNQLAGWFNESGSNMNKDQKLSKIMSAINAAKPADTILLSLAIYHREDEEVSAMQMGAGKGDVAEETASAAAGVAMSGALRIMGARGASESEMRVAAVRMARQAIRLAMDLTRDSNLDEMSISVRTRS